MSSTADNLPEANKLFIGEGVTVKGVVLAAGTIVVDGVLEGDIAVDDLHVSQTGTIRGRISVAKNAEIFGRVLAKLDVKGVLILHSASRVEGVISYGRLSTEPGAAIVGEVSAPDRAAQQLSEPNRRADARSGNGASPVRLLDLSALELMPAPIAATS
jgi:cytoskeletal protein CcmA (bactofilin family)